MRIGTGYDTHRLIEGRKLILGGVCIPYEKGLLGHSDADALTHAIMDAMLGAAALGDIGLHFPDTSDEYKDADSLLLLAKVKEIIADKLFYAENIDATIIAEMPTMRPFIDQMRERVANALDLDVSRVNIKATTNEGMGFVGAGEGISVQAVCLLNTPLDMYDTAENNCANCRGCGKENQTCSEH